MPRFVVQEHFTTPHHFDFMLERGEVLATWSFALPPEQALGGQDGARIHDHRRVYLEYEGEISGGRGRVAIHDRGEYDTLEWTHERVRVTLRGGMLAGEWMLENAGGVDEGGRVRWRMGR